MTRDESKTTSSTTLVRKFNEAPYLFLGIRHSIFGILYIKCILYFPNIIYISYFKYKKQACFAETYYNSYLKSSFKIFIY